MNRMKPSHPLTVSTIKLILLPHRLLSSLLAIGGLALGTASALGQAYNFTSANLMYSENFDSMGPSGTTYINGWTAVRGAGTGTIGQTLPLTVSDGSGNAGAAYNAGSTSASDRAFGTLASGATIPYLGAFFTNSTGGTITNISFVATEEQWRSGSLSTVNEVVTFEYSLDATSPTNGTWTPLSGMNLNELLTSSTTAAAVDGNANNAGISGTIADLNWQNNTTLWIRWRDTDNTGSDGMYAVDDLSMTVTYQPPGAPPSVTDISPLNITTNAGSTVAFTASYIGDSPNFFFWYKETPTSTNLIPSATTATLTLADVLLADMANYQMVISNAYGMDTSAVVSLTVIDPVILSQPVSQQGLLHGRAQFPMSAAGTSLSYQWYFCTDPNNSSFIGSPVNDGIQSSGAVVSGATTSTLTITNLTSTDPTNFVVVVTNIYGALTSSVVTLTVGNTGPLAFWNFNGPFDPNQPAPYQGIGTASAANVEPFIQPNASGNDPAFPNTAWGTQAYPDQGTSNKLAGVRFDVSTVGAKNIMVSFDTRATTTASKYERLQYTTNGTDFIDFPTSSSFASASLYESRSFSLVGFPGARNNPSFGIRIVTELQSTATYGVSNNPNYFGVTAGYTTAGTVSYDLVTISADAITSANTPPTISAIANQTTPDDTPTNVNVTIGDAETPGSLTVTATSLDHNLLGDPSVTGSGSSRTITMTPGLNQDGVVPILVTVTDGSGDSAATWFYLTVNPANQPPTISSLPATNTLANTAITIPFTVGDDRTLGSVTIGGSSGNQTLIPDGNISFGGSGANRSVTLTPVAGKLGAAPITITVNDNDPGTPKSTTATFPLMVLPNTNVVLIDYFDYDGSGAIISQSGGLWQNHSGTAGQMQVGSGQVTVDGGNAEDVNAQLFGQPYAKNSGAVLYSSFSITLSALPTDAGTYFTHFKDNTTSGFLARVFTSTNDAAFGSYRIGIGNSTGSSGTTAQLPQDLILNSNYAVVTRLVMSNGFSTVWINPGSESSPSATDTTTVTNLVDIYAYAFRESTGEGIIHVDNLKVGTTFDSVLPSLHIRPAGANVIVNWSDPTLGIQATTNLLSPFTDVPGATPPYTNTASANGVMFFRFGQ